MSDGAPPPPPPDAAAPPPASEGGDVGDLEDLGAAMHRRLVVARRRGAPLLLAFDVDGTLAPIVARAEDAAVPARTRRVLASLAARPHTTVAVVSGRAPDDAARVVGMERIWVIGNHGAEIVAPDGAATVDAFVAPHADAVAAARHALRADVARVAGAWLEDKRWTLTLHYRQVSDPAAIAALERAAERAAAASGLALHRGKRVFELRPPVRVDKGVALLRLAHEVGATAPGAALLFAGDDVTDEDAFRALRAEQPHAVTVRVLDEDEPPPATAAEFRVPGLVALRDALERLDGWLAPEG